MTWAGRSRSCCARSAWTSGGRGGCGQWAVRTGSPALATDASSLCLGHLVVAGGPVRAGRQLVGHAFRDPPRCATPTRWRPGGFAADFAPDAAAGPRGGERAVGWRLLRDATAHPSNDGRVPGVLGVEQARRAAGRSKHFADLTLALAPSVFTLPARAGAFGHRVGGSRALRRPTW